GQRRRDQRGTAMKLKRIESPVPLARPQRRGGVADRADGNFLRRYPYVLRPGNRAWGPHRDNEAIMNGDPVAELGQQLGDEARGGEVGSAAPGGREKRRILRRS